MKKMILFLCGLLVILLVTGCTDETTGDKVDTAIKSSKEATSKAYDNAKKLFGN